MSRHVFTKRCAAVLALMVLTGSASSFAQPTSGDSAVADVDLEEPPLLEEGFWLRAELGWATNNVVHRELGGVDQTMNTDSPSFALRLGYAPASWIALGFVGDYAASLTDVESAEHKTHTNITTALAGGGARIYPFDFGFSFELAGGWAFAYLNDGTETSLMMGPGFSASIGVDQRIFGPRNWHNEPLGQDAASQLLGMALRLDLAPSVKGEDYEGNAHSISFVVAGTL